MKNFTCKSLKHSSAYLYCAFLTEILLVFYLRNDVGFILSPVIMAIAGLFLAYFPFLLLKHKKIVAVKHNENKGNVKIRPDIYWLIFCGFIIVYWVWSAVLFHSESLDIKQSDIIPFIRVVYLDRLFNEQAVYSQFTGFNYGTFTPSYLPAHWSPFIIPYLLNIDLRWACVGIYSIATFLYSKSLWRIDNSQAGILKLALPWILVYSVYLKQFKDAAHTVEIMIMGYYLILGVFIFSNQVFIRALGIVLPLFSRYAFMFWLPVYACIQWLNSKKLFASLIVWGIVLTCIVFLPFLIQTPHMYKEFNGNYLNGVINEWQGQNWQNPGDRPFQLFQGMGFASWYYFWFDGGLQDKINAIRLTLLYSSVIFMLFQIWLVFRYSIKGHENMIALLTLKAALTVFYLFIMVPYVYLNWIPLVLSVIILSRIQITDKIIEHS